MKCLLKTLALAAAALALPVAADAQHVIIPAPPPAVTTYQTFSPAPIIAAPSVSYAAPVIPAPTTVTHSFYPAITVFSAPAVPATTVYSVPATTVYSAPATTVFSAPVVPAGTVTTRSYYGLGIFRPRGLNTETRYSPSWR